LSGEPFHQTAGSRPAAGRSGAFQPFALELKEFGTKFNSSVGGDLRSLGEDAAPYSHVARSESSQTRYVPIGVCGQDHAYGWHNPSRETSPPKNHIHEAATHPAVAFGKWMDGLKLNVRYCCLRNCR
jgi:hypothetical protein